MIPIPPQFLLSLGTKVLPQLLGSFGSFATAAAQKKAMDEAEQTAAKAVAEARAKLMQAPLEEVQVPTEAYQNAMREITVQSMQLTEAARESGARELAASIGRIGAAGLAATEQQREAMAEDIYKRDMTVAQDEARRLGLQANLDVMEAKGAQLAAAEAAGQRGAALSSGILGLGAAVGGAFESMPLYGFAKEENYGLTSGLSAGRQSMLSQGQNMMLQSQAELMDISKRYPWLNPGQFSMLGSTGNG